MKTHDKLLSFGRELEERELHAFLLVCEAYLHSDDFAQLVHDFHQEEYFTDRFRELFPKRRVV